VIYENNDLPAISLRVSVEHKTIMTAHGKARKNRYGDIIAYSNHMHNHRRDCIAGGIVVINISPKYENPDAFAKGLERPDFNVEKVVKDTVGIFARIPLRNEPGDPDDQPEALAVMLLDYDGVSPAKLGARTSGQGARWYSIRELRQQDLRALRAAIQRTMMVGLLSSKRVSRSLSSLSFAIFT